MLVEVLHEALVNSQFLFGCNGLHRDVDCLVLCDDGELRFVSVIGQKISSRFCFNLRFTTSQYLLEAEEGLYDVGDVNVIIYLQGLDLFDCHKLTLDFQQQTLDIFLELVKKVVHNRF